MRAFLFPLLGVMLFVSGAFAVELQVRSVTHAPDGSAVAASLGERGKPGRVVVWEAKTGKPRFEAKFEDTPVIRFAADGKSIAAGCADGVVRILDAATGKVTGERNHPKAVLALAAGPDGQLATACEDGVVRVWDAAGTQLVRTAEYTPPIRRLAFAPDGKRIAGASDQQAAQWDPVTGGEVWKFGGYTTGVAYSTDGTELVQCVGGDGTVRVTDAGTGAVRVRVKLPGGLSHFDCSPSSGVFVAAYAFIGTEPTLWTQTLRFTPPTADERKQIDGLIRKLDADDIADRETAGDELFKLGAVAEPFLAVAMKDSTSAEVRLRARKLRDRWTTRGHTTVNVTTGSITVLAIAPDVKRVAIGGKDGVVRVLSLPDGKEVQTLRPADR